MPRRWPRARPGRRSGARPGSCSARSAPARLSRHRPVPADPRSGVRLDVVAVEGADRFSGLVDDVDAEVVLGLGAVDFEAQAAGCLYPVVEGLARGGLGRASGSASPALGAPRRGRTGRARAGGGAPAGVGRAAGRHAAAGAGREDREERHAVASCRRRFRPHWAGRCLALRTTLPSLSTACGVSCRARAERVALRTFSSDSPPGPVCKGPCGSPAPVRTGRRDSASLARQYRQRAGGSWQRRCVGCGYHPPAARGLSARFFSR